MPVGRFRHDDADFSTSMLRCLGEYAIATRHAGGNELAVIFIGGYRPFAARARFCGR